MRCPFWGPKKAKSKSKRTPDWRPDFEISRLYITCWANSLEYTIYQKNHEGSLKDTMFAACQAEEEAERGKGLGGPGAGKGFAFLAPAVGPPLVFDIESDDEDVKCNLIKFLSPGDYPPNDF